MDNKWNLAMTGFKDLYDPDFVDDDVYEYTSEESREDQGHGKGCVLQEEEVLLPLLYYQAKAQG